MFIELYSESLKHGYVGCVSTGIALHFDSISRSFYTRHCDSRGLREESWIEAWGLGPKVPLAWELFLKSMNNKEACYAPLHVTSC
jgi:hypothetical protein